MTCAMRSLCLELLDALLVDLEGAGWEAEAECNMSGSE